MQPVRPDGDPRPLLAEDIAPTLARLDAWYADNLPAAEYRLRPPADDAAIDAFEREIGCAMPASWRQLYRWHDGDEDDRHGHIYGLPLLPLAEVTREWRSWRQVIEDFGGDCYAVAGASWPEGAIDPAYSNPRWIPLTADGSGNHIGLDLDPWPGGRTGQVILFGRDEDRKIVLAESLGAFLSWIADSLESGNVRLTVEPGETVLHNFQLRDPADDHFHDGARILLGAPGPYL